MNQPTPNQVGDRTLTADEIQTWLVNQIAEQSGMTPDEIDVTIPFESFGLDSAQGLLIASRAEKWLNVQLSPVLLWHYPTVETLSQRLAEETASSDSEVFEI